MSEDNVTTPPDASAADATAASTSDAAAAPASANTPAEDPAVDLAKQNEQTVAQTNAINDAVKATQVCTSSVWLRSSLNYGHHALHLALAIGHSCLKSDVVVSCCCFSHRR